MEERSNVEYMERALEITSTLEKRFNTTELAAIFGIVNPRASALIMNRLIKEHYNDGVEVTINRILVAIGDVAITTMNGRLP